MRAFVTLLALAASACATTGPEQRSPESVRQHRIVLERYVYSELFDFETYIISAEAAAEASINQGIRSKEIALSSQVRDITLDVARDYVREAKRDLVREVVDRALAVQASRRKRALIYSDHWNIADAIEALNSGRRLIDPFLEDMAYAMTRLEGRIAAECYSAGIVGDFTQTDSFTLAQ